MANGQTLRLAAEADAPDGNGAAVSVLIELHREAQEALAKGLTARNE